MIRDQLASAVRDALVALAVDPLPETINLERPARREHGDDQDPFHHDLVVSAFGCAAPPVLGLP